MNCRGPSTARDDRLNIPFDDVQGRAASAAGHARAGDEEFGGIPMYENAEELDQIVERFLETGSAADRCESA